MQEHRFAAGVWNLGDALPAQGGKELGSMVEELKAKAKEFESFRPRLALFDSAAVSSALASVEELYEGVARISSAAFMKYTADTGDEAAKSALDAAEDLEAEVTNRTLFFRLWWTGLKDADASRLAPRNRDHRYFLSSWRKLKPYTLAEDVEKAVNLKNLTGFASWSHHYDKVTSRFVFYVQTRKGGRPRRMVADQVTRLFASPDAGTREAAYTALLGKYAEEGAVLGEVYRVVARDWRNENVKLRGYRAPISTRNMENDVSDEAVRRLLEACGRNVSVFQEFFRMKARMLGMKKMSRYHLYAPLATKQREVPYGEAVDTVLEAFTAFDPRAGELARRVFERRHVDSSPRHGKRSGAYCMSVVPSVAPYLFLNFAGANRDVYTIAHESGHAIHSQLASSHSVLTFHPPLVLAETASVFGEMMLFDKTMADERDVEVKRSVLLEKISSMYATIGRQSHFVMFEEAAHDKVEAGATVDDLCEEYIRNLRGQFGSALTVPDEFRWEWTYIPHIFHTPFYCYSYAFGNLLSLALYDRYTKEGRSFVPQYLRVLAYGGSEAPSKILEEVGFDMESPGFWQGGFDVISRMVERLRAL